MVNHVRGLILSKNITKQKKNIWKGNRKYMDTKTNLGALSSDQIKRIQLKEIIRNEHFLYCSSRIEMSSGMRVLLLFFPRMRGFSEESRRKEKMCEITM